MTQQLEWIWLGRTPQDERDWSARTPFNLTASIDINNSPPAWDSSTRIQPCAIRLKLQSFGTRICFRLFTPGQSCLTSLVDMWLVDSYSTTTLLCRYPAQSSRNHVCCSEPHRTFISSSIVRSRLRLLCPSPCAHLHFGISRSLI